MRLVIDNITKKFKHKTAVDHFSMVIETNECVGLIGPNGLWEIYTYPNDCRYPCCR